MMTGLTWSMKGCSLGWLVFLVDERTFTLGRWLSQESLLCCWSPSIYWNRVWTQQSAIVSLYWRKGLGIMFFVLGERLSGFIITVQWFSNNCAPKKMLVGIFWVCILEVVIRMYLRTIAFPITFEMKMEACIIYSGFVTPVVLIICHCRLSYKLTTTIYLWAVWVEINMGLFQLN